MKNITNLRQFRKQAARGAKREAGAENAARHGQSKAARMLAATRDDQSRKMLDQHRMSDPDET